MEKFFDETVLWVNTMRLEEIASGVVRPSAASKDDAFKLFREGVSWKTLSLSEMVHTATLPARLVIVEYDGLGHFTGYRRKGPADSKITKMCENHILSRSSVQLEGQVQRSLATTRPRRGDTQSPAGSSAQAQRAPASPMEKIPEIPDLVHMAPAAAQPKLELAPSAAAESAAAESAEPTPRRITRSNAASPTAAPNMPQVSYALPSHGDHPITPAIFACARHVLPQGRGGKRRA